MSENVLELKNLRVAFRLEEGEIHAVQDVSLAIPRGKIVALVGESGSGKSTLINVFTGIDHPTAGEALVAETRIRDLDEGQMAEWRGRHLGIVGHHQEPPLTLAISRFGVHHWATTCSPSSRPSMISM